MIEIPHFEIIRPIRYDYRLGKEGFQIRLDGEIARQTYELELLRDYYRGLQQEGVRILLEKGFSHPSSMKSPYTFIRSMKSVNHTGLLQFCSTPNTNHDLSADPEQIRLLIDGKSLEVLEYRSYVVNDQAQADALKSLWKHWFDQMAKELNL